jgi:hypothetical protein
MTQDEMIQELRNAKPAWQADNKGVRGDPVVFHSSTAQTSFPKSTVEIAPALTPPTPALPPGAQVPLGGSIADVVP